MRGWAGKTTGSSTRARAPDDPAQPLRPNVRLAVDGGDDVRPGIVRRRNPLARDRREAKRRVGHHVTHHERRSADTLGGERRDRALVGAEQKHREAVDLDPRPLLRHREVAAAKPGLDVRERDPGGGGRPRSGERGVRVAEDEDGVGPLGVDDAAHGGRQRLDVGRAEVEPVRGLRQPELLEEDLRELVVPMLAGVDDDFLDLRLAERHRERRRLDELRPVPYDGEDAHRAPA